MNFSEDFSVINPGCGCARFAVPTNTYDRWRKDHTRWHCPACGEVRYFSGESSEAKELRQTKERLQQEQTRAAAMERKATTINRQYERMKTRVKNGVCPCCTRSFDNLARHMKGEHPDFGDDKNLKTLRLLYGLTQHAAAKNIGVQATYISAFENGKYIPEWAKNKIVQWLESEAS